MTTQLSLPSTKTELMIFHCKLQKHTLQYNISCRGHSHHIEIDTVLLLASSRCIQVSEVGYYCTPYCISIAADVPSDPVLHKVQQLQCGGIYR